MTAPFQPALPPPPQVVYAFTESDKLVVEQADVLKDPQEGKEAEEGDDVRRDERGSTRVVGGGASAGGIASDAAGRDDAWRTSIVERFELLTERLDEIEARMVGDMREIRFELRELIEELHTAES